MSGSVTHDWARRVADPLEDLDRRMAGEGYRFECGFRGITYYRHPRHGERAFVVDGPGSKVTEVTVRGQSHPGTGDGSAAAGTAA